jgi:hypothetical protein
MVGGNHPPQPEEPVMTQQTVRRPDTEIARQHSSPQQPNRHLWLLAVLLSMAVAGIVGVAVTAHLTGPATTTHSVYNEPNPNAREGRVPTTSVDPNPNSREGRVSTATSVDPNANAREGRVPTATSVDPNPNAREGRVPGNG